MSDQSSLFKGYLNIINFYNYPTRNSSNLALQRPYNNLREVFLIPGYKYGTILILKYETAQI